MIKYLIVLFCCLTLISCVDNVKSTVHGWWTIDSLVYKNREIDSCLLGNSIFFKNEVKLPVTENLCSGLITEFNNEGKWNILYSDTAPIILNIVSENKIFAGSHQLFFRSSPDEHILKMIIKSKNLYVVCRKGLFDYDRNLSLIKYLENKTDDTAFDRYRAQQNHVETIGNNTNKIINDSGLLEIGWYYISDSGYERYLVKSKNEYYIDPLPIVTAKNIIDCKLYKFTNANEIAWGLRMQLDSNGTQNWKIATSKMIGRKIAFILDNQLLEVSQVNNEISNGTTALNTALFSKQELENFKNIIERER
jgi:hypothetical protein